MKPTMSAYAEERCNVRAEIYDKCAKALSANQELDKGELK